MLPLLLSHKPLWTLTIGLLTAVPALPLACQATTTGEFEVETPALRVKGGFKGEGSSKKLDLESQPPLTCVAITFTDPQGNPVGSWSGPLPVNGIPVPAGGTHCSAQECPEPEERLASGPAGKLRRVRDWFFWGSPIEPNLVAGELSYAVTISATSLSRAEDLLEELLAEARQGVAGLERRPGGVYRIHHMARTRLAGTNVMFEFFDDGAFETLDFELNGVAQMRTIQDAATLEIGGWHAAVLAVPVTTFDVGAAIGTTYHNEYSFDISNDGVPATLDGFWDYRLL